MSEEKKYPEGHFKSMWMMIGIASFSAIGIPLSFILNMQSLIGVGPLVGVILGMIIGERYETKHKEAGNLRQLTDKEVRNKKILIIVIFFTGLIGFAVLLFAQ